MQKLMGQAHEHAKETCLEIYTGRRYGDPHYTESELFKETRVAMYRQLGQLREHYELSKVAKLPTTEKRRSMSL